MSNQRVGTVLGTLEMGRRADHEESEEMFTIFRNYGHTELDTAHRYGIGAAEKFIGDFSDQNFIIASKANAYEENTLKPECIRKQIEESLHRLKRNTLDIFYLHNPDHNTPLHETLKEVNQLHKENKFKELGLSNYSSWLVAEIYNICRENNWVLPTVYQGLYNAVIRTIEPELIPCLRYYNIRFYAYNPLGGGFLSGKHKIDDTNKPPNHRFFGKGVWVDVHKDRYWKPEYFDGIENIKSLLNGIYGDGKVSQAEAAYRWLYHHSMLDGKYGDAVIVGAANTSQLRSNLEYTTKGPLDDRIVKAYDELWKCTSKSCAQYFI